MAKVVLNNLIKKYDNVETIKDVSLTIDDKEFIVLVGPSGCGKSTILRMIAGLEEITEGKIVIGDRIVNDIAPKDRNIAMVFQNYALYPHMSVYDNLAFGLKMRKFPKADIDIRVKKAAEILHITEYLARKPRQLSGGQRQRVALGRAIVRDPAVFLMDEPLSNLDAKLRVQMRSELIKLHKELQTTFIYVTHDQVEAMTMGDRIVILNEGIIQQVDAPGNIYSDPGNMFVASFIGSPSMNFIKGKIGEDNVFRAYDFSFSLNDELFNIAKSNNSIDKEIVLGIRPEHFAIEEGLEPMISVKPTLVEMLGSEKLIHFSIGVIPVTAKVLPEHYVTEESDVTISLQLDKAVLFDPESQKRLR
jgi:multiple sugar transport system ATP-binding protein